MRFPIIRVRDKAAGGEHIVGSNCHDKLVISNGALHYLNIQCMGGTEFGDGYEFVGEPEYEGDGMFGDELFVEMVSLGTLLEIAAQEDREEIRRDILTQMLEYNLRCKTDDNLS